MRSLPSIILAAVVFTSAIALANGGVSRWLSASTDGAVMPGEAGALGKRVLVPERDVECTSEALTLTLQEKGVDVVVEYAFVNRGKTKTIEYGFPFAIGVIHVMEGDRQTKERTLGEPTGYSIEIDGAKAAAKVSPGDTVPGDIPTPNIDDNRDIPKSGDGYDDVAPASGAATASTEFRWSYRVTPIEFPKGKPVKVRVSYSAPWLVYSQSSELGSVASPGTFSYLLSTGAGWRKGTIGKFRAKIVGAGIPLSRVMVDGPSFTQSAGEVSFEETDFKPTVASNIVLKVSDWSAVGLEGIDENAKALLAAKPKSPWQTPPVGNGGTVALGFKLAAGRIDSYARFRIGMLIDNDPANAHLKKATVELRYGSKPPDVFHASFREVSTSDVEATGGLRYIHFDTIDYAPVAELHLTLTGVFPGTGGNGRLRISQIVVERDVSDYEPHVGVPR